MDSMVFKYKQQIQHQHHHLYQPQLLQQQQHFTSSNSLNTSNSSSSTNYHNISNSSSSSIGSNSNNHNNNNQNSIFILNTATNNILPNNPKLYYADLNENNNVPLTSPLLSSSSSSSSATCAYSSTTTATSSSSSSSVWSSASSTMCSPAAHAIQKLFNCSSNSLKLNHGAGNHSGIEVKPFKSKSDLMKKKTKFWKYLEGEANDKNNQRGIEDSKGGNYKKLEGKSLKTKSKYWSKSCESDNQNPSDLSELLEYSCSLCDNCRCMDCQIGYFDCDNSDDSNSEYSLNMSAYEDEEQNEETNQAESNVRAVEREVMELKHDCEFEGSEDHCCSKLNNNPNYVYDKLQIEAKSSANCSLEYCVCNDETCAKNQCCQQCWLENEANDQCDQLLIKTQRDH